MQPFLHRTPIQMMQQMEPLPVSFTTLKLGVSVIMLDFCILAPVVIVCTCVSVGCTYMCVCVLVHYHTSAFLQIGLLRVVQR